MTPQGSAPFSSIFYLTKRKKLSEKLFEHKNETSNAEYQYNYANVFHPSFKSDTLGNVGIHKKLIYLSQDRLKFETSDKPELDVDDGFNRGLNYLSLHSDVINLNEVDEFSRSYYHSSVPEDKFIGKVDDIAKLLESDEPSGTEGVRYKTLERDFDLSDRYVGPLNASEVGNLLALALKLQENEKLDLDLEKRLEVSAQLWKNNRVPNTVSTFLISSLYKNKPFQCSTCGLRFSLSDTKTRHEMTHKGKSHGFWYSLQGWVHLSSKGAFGVTYTRSLVTLDTFKRLLIDIPCEEETVKWLKQMLFPNDLNLTEAVMAEDVKEMGPKHEQKQVSSAENLCDEKALWSWGIMDACDEVPRAPSTHETTFPDVDGSVFNQMLKNLRFNIFTINLRKPVVGSFGDMSKSFCVICRDSLRCEFDVKYSKFVYVDTSSFQLDFKLLPKMFPESVPLSYLLSMDKLDQMDVLELLKKISAIRLISLDLMSKMDLSINDWSFKYVRELLDIDASIPKMDNVKYIDKLFRGWKNPFKFNDRGAQCIIYAHTCCLRLLLNSHLRLAKSKAGSLANEEFQRGLGELALV